MGSREIGGLRWIHIYIYIHILYIYVCLCIHFGIDWFSAQTHIPQGVLTFICVAFPIRFDSLQFIVSICSLSHFLSCLLFILLVVCRLHADPLCVEEFFVLARRVFLFLGIIQFSDRSFRGCRWLVGWL